MVGAKVCKMIFLRCVSFRADRANRECKKLFLAQVVDVVSDN